MQTDLILWEDLNDIHTRTEQTLQILQRIAQAINAGCIDHPSRQDSKHLNRLLALAELMHAEANRWSADLKLEC